MPRLPVLLALAAALAGCDLAGPDRPTTPVEIPVSPLTEAVIAQSNAFGVSLFARVVAGDDANVMLSPLSASAALTMLLNGADGETYAQIRDALGYSSLQDLDAVNGSYRSLRSALLAADPDVQLALANAVFHDRAYPVLPSFVERVTGTFDARVDALDFAAPGAVGVINQWASDHTAGRVPKVIERIRPNTVLFMLDALYFKGEWSTPFKPSSTRPGEFLLADGQAVTVPMMEGHDVSARLVEGDGYKAVELPYGRRNFSMVLMTPDHGVPLSDLVGRLDDGLWAEATARLDAEADWGDVLVRMPRFSFETDKVLNDPLKALGIVDAFEGADLSRLSPAGGNVAFVKQDTFVEVNEEGDGGRGRHDRRRRSVAGASLFCDPPVRVRHPRADHWGPAVHRPGHRPPVTSWP